MSYFECFSVMVSTIYCFNSKFRLFFVRDWVFAVHWDLTKVLRRRQRERLKLKRFIWAKQQLCTCKFHSRRCTTTTQNDQILSWLENGNSKAINFSISLRTQKRFPLFSSNLTFLLSSNWVASYKGEKVSRDAKSIFQRRFHWCRPCRIVRSL